MKNAIILHGLPDKEEYYDESLPSSSNSQWFPWLQKRLLVHGIKADTPEVPLPFEMKWDVWVKEMERFEMGPETILIGHSMGGGFWVRYLSEHPDLRVAKVILVAPWLNLQHEEDTDFFDFKLRPEIADQAGSFVVFASDNDMEDVARSVQFLRSSLPSARFVDFHSYGHFCLEDMGTEAFPELLEEALSR